jgi:hypothetical protein
MFDHVLKKCIDLFQEKKQVVYTLTENIIRGVVKTAVDIGDQLAQKIRDDFDRFDQNGSMRTLKQIEICDLVVQVCAKIIYRDCFIGNEEYIYETNAWLPYRCLLTIQAPRRLGKTWSVCIGLTILLMNIPNFKIMVVTKVKANGTKTSGIIGTLRYMLTRYFNITVWEKDSETQLWFDVDGTTRKVGAFTER